MLPEIHAAPEVIARVVDHGYPTYDFLLPGLVLDALRTARAERLGPRIEVRVETPFPPGRTRINCTMPGAGGRWHWFGRQFYVAP